MSRGRTGGSPARRSVEKRRWTCYTYAGMRGSSGKLRGLSHRGEYLAARLLSSLLRALPLPIALRLGDFLGSVMFHVVRVRRGVILEQLGRAFPEMPTRSRLRCGADCYRNLARTAVETIRWHGGARAALADRIRMRGARHLDEALALGRGVIIVTFHFGNWELAGAHLAGLGYPVSVVVQRIHNPFLDRMVSEARLGAGMRTIERGNAVRGVARALRENRVVGILSDQDAREGGVFVPFLGRPASTPRGPAVLSIRLEAPALTAIMVRRRDGGFDFLIEPIACERVGDLDTDVRRFTASYTARLEEFVRKHPEQWLWQHRRWKSAPAEGG